MPAGPRWNRAGQSPGSSEPRAWAVPTSTRPRVEILSFAGCPYRDSARDLVERVVGELHIEADVELVDVADPEAAARLRFLGSPTIRVDGRDVEPGADERTEYALSCRVYATQGGLAGEPDARWLHAALASAR